MGNIRVKPRALMSIMTSVVLRGSVPTNHESSILSLFGLFSLKEYFNFHCESGLNDFYK